MSRSTFTVTALLLVLVAGCATPPPPAPPAPLVPPDVPSAIRPAAGETLFLEALATGAQVYECVPRADDPTFYAWAFKGPEAALTDKSGRSLGKHYAGPTWESVDGSKVVGEVTAREAGPDRRAIPWMLLSAKSTSGTGLFANTKSIQRVKTTGGVGPTTPPCMPSTANQVLRVPYTATYYFYR
jgi:hypothetical protein